MSIPKTHKGASNYIYLCPLVGRSLSAADNVFSSGHTSKDGYTRSSVCLQNAHEVLICVPGLGIILRIEILLSNNKILTFPLNIIHACSLKQTGILFCSHPFLLPHSKHHPTTRSVPSTAKPVKRAKPAAPAYEFATSTVCGW